MTFEDLVTFCPIEQFRGDDLVGIDPDSVPERLRRLIVETYEDYVGRTGHEPFHGVIISADAKEVCVG
jgi:hypothetical protein